MNTHRNPNLYRFGLAVTTILTLGSAACSGPEAPLPPSPLPPPGASEAPPYPQCSVAAIVQRRAVTISLNTMHESQPGVYTVDSADYDHGDGSRAANVDYNAHLHTYIDPGTYSIKGWMNMQVAPYARAPFRNNSAIPCDPITIEIR